MALEGSACAATLLYVEDEEITRTTVCTLLARKFPELSIRAAADGEEGLRLFCEIAPDLVVTDIRMPVMNGIEMSKRIMAIRGGVPIIVTSAHSDTEYLIECIESGITHYVIKPINMAKLFAAVESALASHRLKRELQEQQAFVRKLSRAVEQSANGVAITDPCGVVEYVNRSFSALTGYQPADVLGRNLRELQRTGEQSWVTAAAGFEWHGELESATREGEPYSEAVSIAPVLDELGAVANLVVTKQDITERRKSAREIELLNQRLSAHAEELESANRDMEGFSYTVSHDLRSPLSTINGYCQLIQELYGASLDEECARFIQVIYQETVTMGELIRTLLDFSLVSRGEISRSRVDLSETATTIAAGLMLREPERQAKIEIAPGLSAHGDPALLRAALDNLLSNAWKYTANKEQTLIEVGAEPDGEESVYFVRDNGAGFEMAQAGKLFHAFQRLHTEQEFKGFGIGLATVQRIVQRHGGRIWAEGETGKGAIFRFTLP